MKKFNLLVEKADGMWIVISDDAVPGARLYVIEGLLENALAAVPAALQELKADLRIRAIKERDNVITLPVIRVERFD